MTRDREITDEELTAFLDGEADPDLCQRIQSAMDDGLEMRIAQLDRGRDLATEAFREVLANAPAQPKLKSFSGTALGFSTIGLAAGIVLALAVDWAWQGWGTASDIEPWHREVAAYHALYVTETLTSRPTPGDDLLNRMGALSALVGLDLSVSTQSTDLEFRRAQRLGYEGVPLVQIAYLAPGGVPVALCVLRSAGAQKDISVTRIQGMSAASWADADRRYLLVGGTDDAATARRARDIAKRLHEH